ncbi:MAG TPA: ABC transporter permease [Stellaceae bacterium]|nr:ABC transporter permease [Stellaceae bacterium]
MQPGRLVGLVPMLGLLVLWQVAVLMHLYPQVLLPPPAKVAAAFSQFGPSIAANTLASVTRVLIGISLAFIVAVPAGLLIGRYQVLDRLTNWSIQTFRSVPPISLIPMAMLFFGIGDTPAIVLIFLSGLWPLLLNTIFGVRGIERTMLKVATAAGASEALILRDIIWPAVLPNIFTGLRLAVGGGWLTVVTAEMIAVKSGLGYMILNAQMTFRPELIFAGIIVIGGIGLLGDYAVHRLRVVACAWQEGLTAHAD